MKVTAISVSEAARNFSDCIKRVHSQNMAFVVLKNGKPMARIVPDHEKRCAGRDLARALSKLKLSAEEARGWQRDLQTAREALKLPSGKWQ